MKLKTVTKTATPGPRVFGEFQNPGIDRRISQRVLTTSRPLIRLTQPTPATMSTPVDKRPREPDQAGQDPKRAKPTEAEPERLQAQAKVTYKRIQAGLSDKLLIYVKLAARADGLQDAYPHLAAVLKLKTGAGVSKTMTNAEVFIVASCHLYLQANYDKGQNCIWKEDTASPLGCKVVLPNGVGAPATITYQRWLHPFLACYVRKIAAHIARVTTANPLAEIGKTIIDQLRVVIGILIWKKLETPKDAEVQQLVLVVVELMKDFPARRLIPRPAPHYVGVSGVDYPC